MMVSVIIPVYNRSKMVKEAIDSVLAQDFKEFELIVVDDGSTDDTTDILKSYGNHIIVIRQENKGVSAARNKGITHSNSEWIALLDSDDLWMPNKLSSQVSFIKSNPGVLICQTEEIWIKNGIRINPKKHHKKESGMIFERSLRLCLVSPSAVIIKRSLLDEVGLFDESLLSCEDYDMWLRIGCRYPIYLLNNPLIIKQGGHLDQLSMNPGLDRYRISSLKKIIDSGILSFSQKKAAINVLREKCLIYANGCKKHGKSEEAKYYLSLPEWFNL